MNKNMQTVKDIYAAFQKGDIDSIMKNIDENVVWEYAPTTANIPWLAPRKGKKEAAGFFEALQQVEIKNFTVNHVVGDDKVVVGLVSVEGHVKATGKSFKEMDEPHVWYFSSNGKVSKFRHAADTYKHYEALQK